MAHIMKGGRETWRDLDLISIALAFKSLQNLPDVVAVVKRLDTGPPPSSLLLIDITAVVFLDPSRILQHDPRKIRRRPGEIDFSREALSW
jgi:hypothetical protein